MLLENVIAEQKTRKMTRQKKKKIKMAKRIGTHKIYAFIGKAINLV